MMVMMVMVVPLLRVGLRMTVVVCAFFTLGLQFQSNMADAVGMQVLTGKEFGPVGIAGCYNMHGGAGGLTVQTPQVDMMDIQDLRQLAQVIAKRLRADAVRGFFQEKLADLLQIFCGVEENEQSHGHRQNGIKEGPICKAHNDSAYQDYGPA